MKSPALLRLAGRLGESRPAPAKSCRSPLLALLLLVLLLVIPRAAAGDLWGQGAPTALTMGEGPPAETIYVQYDIDRSAVPAWVRHRELTLRIAVGPTVEHVWAWGDGQPLVIDLDGDNDLARVTTGATHVLVAAQGAGLTPSDLGPARKAVLKDDKLWAYSLTFDDGQYSVYQYAYPELRRYGYRAGIPVIGRWLDEIHVPAESGYCGPDELLEMMAAGWSVFNHSYLHSSAPADITFDEAWRCQQAIQTHLGGYKAIAFTTPQYTPLVAALWRPIIDDNMDILGLYMVQAKSDVGDRLPSVDDSISLENGALHIGRDDVKHWLEGAYNYFDQAHGAALASAARHSWVSLHAHKVTYDEDWCGVADSSAYLYNTYGQGGTDEVWMAPADEVFEYLVVRSYATVVEEEPSPLPIDGQVQPPQVVQYQQGQDGYTEARDTYIDQGSPTESHPLAHGLELAVGPNARAVLLQFDTESLPAEAIIERATVSIYASWLSGGGVDFQVAPLLVAWDDVTANWNRASAEDGWEQPGAAAVGLDRGRVAGQAHVEGGANNARWYSMDVTDLVRQWHSGHQTNHGMIIRSSGSVYRSSTIVSSEHPDRSRHPKLTVVCIYPMHEAASVEATAVPSQPLMLPLLFAQ